MGNEAFITEEVLRYIKDETYQYAVLLDGEWGTGKTYFVKVILKPKIEECLGEKIKKVLYLSLYGTKTVSEIQDRFFNCIFSESGIVKGLSDKIKKVKPLTNLLQTGKVSGESVAQTKGFTANPYSLFSNWIDFSKYCFIVDDLERCECSINQILGFLNILVEQKCAKLIIVANEAEIGTVQQSENLALQFLVAANNNIKVPLIDKYTGQEKRVPSIDKNELERRSAILFDQVVSNDEYRRIKEKLIGVTLKFQPDINNIINQIIGQSGIDEHLREKLVKENDILLDIMEQHAHKNLRTYQFFISKIIFLYQKLGEIDIEKQYLDMMTEGLIILCFLDCIVFKGNLTKEQIVDTFWSLKRDTLPSVINYVEQGIFQDSDFHKDINNYIFILQCEIIPNDPLGQLLNGYWKNTQTWNEKKIGEVLLRVKEGAYPIATYPELLRLFCRLEAIGFPEQYGNQLADNMCFSVLEKDNLEPIDFDSVITFINEADMKDRAKNIADKVNGKIYELLAGKGMTTVKEVLANNDFANGIKEYTNSEYFLMLTDKSIFSKATSDEWIKAIQNADIENLYTFTLWLRDRYAKVTSVVERQKDISILNDLLTTISSEDEDIIRAYYVREIKSIITTIIDVTNNTSYI